MFGDIYDIIVDKPKRGAAEVVGYENGGLVVLLDYGDGNIIKKLTAQGIINGTTWYPLKDFNQPTLDELRPTSGVGRLYGKVGFLKGTTNNGIFGIFDVEGIEIKALLEQPHHTALKVGVGTFSETRNPWVFEPPDEQVTSQEPVWLCPFQHADGSYKLASYGRMLYSGLDTFEWDGDSYGTPVSLPNKGYLFFDRFSTVLTEQDLQYEGGFANPSFVGTKYSELSGMFYEDFNFLNQVENNYKSKLEHFYGTYVFSEGIGGFEYLLRYQPATGTRANGRADRPLEWFGTYVGSSWNLQSAEGFYAMAHMGSHFRARRLVFYDMVTEKFYLIPGAGLPWMIQLEASFPSQYMVSYTNNRNYNTFLYDFTFSYSRGLIKGVFVVNEINIDPIENMVSMSGETTWFDSDIEHYVGDAIDSTLASYAPSTPCAINYLKLDQLPEGNLALFDDAWENVLDEIAVTPGTYASVTATAWIATENIGNVSYVISPSVQLEYYFPSLSTITASSSISTDVAVNMDFVNTTVLVTPFKPMYCISPPAEYLPMADVDGYLYNILQPYRQQDQMALAIPHIEWMSLYGEDETDKPKAIQTFLNPEQNASDKPNVEEIILDFSSIDLPDFEQYRIRIYLKPGDTVMRCYDYAVGASTHSFPFIHYDQNWDGAKTHNYFFQSPENFGENHMYNSAALFKPFDVYFGTDWNDYTLYWKPGTYYSVQPFDLDWCTEIWYFRGDSGRSNPGCAKSAGNPLDEDLLFGEYSTIGDPYFKMFYQMPEAAKNQHIANGYLELSLDDIIPISKYTRNVEEIVLYRNTCYNVGAEYRRVYPDEFLPCNRPKIRIPVTADDFTYCSDADRWCAPAWQYKSRKLCTYDYYDDYMNPVCYSLVARVGGFIEQQYFENIETATKISGWFASRMRENLLIKDTYCETAGAPLPVFTFSGSETLVSPSAFDPYSSEEARVVSKVADVFAPFTGAPLGASITGYLIETISQSSWYDCPNRNENWYTQIDASYESPEIIDLYTVPVYLSGFKIEIKKPGQYDIPGYVFDVDLPSPISQTPTKTFSIDGQDFAVMPRPTKYAKISIRLPILKTKKLFLSDDLNAKVINLDKISGSFREVKWDEIES